MKKFYQLLTFIVLLFLPQISFSQTVIYQLREDAQEQAKKLEKFYWSKGSIEKCDSSGIIFFRLACLHDSTLILDFPNLKLEENSARGISLKLIKKYDNWFCDDVPWSEDEYNSMENFQQMQLIKKALQFINTN